MFASPATLVKAVRHFGVGGALRLVTGMGRTSGMAEGASAYPAVQNLLLAARALGLGTTLTTLHRTFEDALRRLLAIPPEVEVAALVPLGYPADGFGPTRRKPVEAVTFRDRWGSPFRT